MKPSQVASKLRQIAAAIDNSKNPRKDLVAADLHRVVTAIEDFKGFRDPNDPKIVELFRKYVGELADSDQYADALGFEEVLSDAGIEATVEYGPYGDLDFYELAGEISDEFMVEEQGSDKFSVTRLSGLPTPVPKDIPK